MITCARDRDDREQRPGRDHQTDHGQDRAHAERTSRSWRIGRRIADRRTAWRRLAGMANATLHTNHGAIEIELFPADAPKTVENFHKLARRRLLRRRHLPPRDPGLHDPGRRPDRHRHRAAPATRSRTSSTSTRSCAARSRWRTPARTRTAASSSSSPPTRALAGREAHRLRPRHGGMDVVDAISSGRDRRLRPAARRGHDPASGRSSLASELPKRPTGIEPVTKAWKALVLPLHHGRAAVA